jgi:hypothetical protein
MGVKLTKRVVESIGQGDRDVVVWDTELRGFGCKVTPKGLRSYLSTTAPPTGSSASRPSVCMA